MRQPAPALVVPHREDGVWVCGRWRFVCTPCGIPSVCAFTTPGRAADWARAHLNDAHLIEVAQHLSAKPTTSRSTP